MDDKNRIFRQEQLIFEVTELACETMERQAVSRKELAQRLGKTPGYISQVLDGSANITLRTLSDVFAALGQRVEVRVFPHKK